MQMVHITTKIQPGNPQSVCAMKPSVVEPGTAAIVSDERLYVLGHEQLKLLNLLQSY